MPKFAIIGAAGYVAPRHMQAIKDVGGELVAALDPHDSVGILDSYAPECLYFREPERFDRWLSKNPVDYVSVCSPNYLHDSHALMAMRNGADVICEKPLVCSERNLDNLAVWEVRTGRKVNAILQCRLHESSINAASAIDGEDHYSVIVDYSTPRGPWYDYSWKSDVPKSGGLATNIGVHLFDLCIWLFGRTASVGEQCAGQQHAEGYVSVCNADIHWSLSINGTERKRLFRILPFDSAGFDIDLTNGFESLHTQSYEKILAGEGFGIADARPAIRLVEAIRNAI